MARNIHSGRGLSGSVQFGPLYPLFIAPLFNLGDLERVYYAIRWANVLAFASIALPVYLLGRELLPASLARIAIPVTVILMPFGAYAYVVWAEPVYYAVFAWVVYLYYLYATRPQAGTSALCGVALGLLFLLKPVGVVFQIAAIIAPSIVRSVSERKPRVEVDRNLLWLVAGALLLTLPWMLRNVLLEGVGLLGYPDAHWRLQNRMDTDGLQVVTVESGISVLYQLAHFASFSFGGLAALTAILAVRWRDVPRAMRIVIVFLLLAVCGVVTISAVHMTAYRMHLYPNGRYFSAFFPFFLLFAIGLLHQGPPLTLPWKLFAAVSCAFAAIVATASPLFVLSPHSVVNNAELSFVTFLVDEGRVIWRNTYEPEPWARLAFAAGTTAVGVGMVYLVATRRTLVAFLAGLFILNVGMSVAEYKLVKIIGKSQVPMNSAVAYMARQEKLGYRSAFDAELEKGNSPFIYEFWAGSGTPARYLDAGELIDGREPPRETGNAEQGDSLLFLSAKSLPLEVAFSSGYFHVYRVALR